MAYSRIYRHPKRPEWGMAVVCEEVDDCVRFMFEDLEIRAFKANNLQVLELVDLPEDAAAALRGKLIRKKPAVTRVRKKAKAVVAVAKAEPGPFA